MTDYLNFALELAKANWDFLALIGLVLVTAVGIGIADFIRAMLDMLGAK